MSSGANKKKRSAPTTSKDVVPSKRKSSPDNDLQKNNNGDDEVMKDVESRTLAQMFDGYTTDYDSLGFIVCMIDTIANPNPPQLLVQRDTTKNDFFAHQLDSGITKDFADCTKQVRSIRFNLACKTGLELKLVFGRNVRKGGYQIEYGAVTFCEAVLWAEAFFSVHIDSRYARIINKGYIEYDKHLFETTKERDIQMGKLPRLWRHDVEEKTFPEGMMRGSLVSSLLLIGFCELVRGHFISSQK
jgi:hypothetical protein